MQPARVLVYSLAFKRQVDDEIESGRFTIGSASLHYGIQATSLLTAEYLKFACEQLGQDVEAFKKKSDAAPSAG